MERRAFLGGATGLALGAIAGCVGGGSGRGGGGPTGSSGGTVPSTGAVATGGGGAMADYPDYDWEQLSAADAAETSTVSTRDAGFAPLVARVPVGATLTFANGSDRRHTVTMPALAVDETLVPGEATAVTFEAAGPHDYVCRRHPPGMLGRVVVY